jgi:hypothetical protein
MRMRKQLPAQLLPSSQAPETAPTTERDIQTEEQRAEPDVPEGLRMFLEQQALPAGAHKAEQAGDDEDEEYMEPPTTPPGEKEGIGAGAGAGAALSSISTPSSQEQPESSTPFTKQLSVPAGVPTGKRQVAAKMLALIQANPDKIARGRDGSLYLNRRLVPKSHFNSLIVSLYADPDPRHPLNLTGRAEFTKALENLIGQPKSVKSSSTRSLKFSPQKGKGLVARERKGAIPPGRLPRILRLYR